MPGRGSAGLSPRPRAQHSQALSRIFSRCLFLNSAERGAAHSRLTPPPSPRGARWCGPPPPPALAMVRAALAPPRARRRHCGLFVRARSERGREAAPRLRHVHPGAPPPDARLQEVSEASTHRCPAPLCRARGGTEHPRGRGAPRGERQCRGERGHSRGSAGSRRAAPALFEPPRPGADGWGRLRIDVGAVAANQGGPGVPAGSRGAGMSGGMRALPGAVPRGPVRPGPHPPPPSAAGTLRNSSGGTQKCSGLVGAEGLSANKFFVIVT